MGLAISVGYLAEMMALDEEGAEWFRSSLATVDQVLRDAGEPPHAEPTHPVRVRGGIGSFPYSYLHYLRRAYACVVEKVPLREGDLTPEDDTLVMDVTVTLMDSHLLSHSDCAGYYLPRPLPDGPICDERLPGGFLGSSQGLVRELLRVAPALGIALDGDAPTAEALDALATDPDAGPQSRARIAWHRLYLCARASIEHGTLIVFH